MTDEPFIVYGERRPRIHDIVEIDGVEGSYIVGTNGWRDIHKLKGDDLRYRVVGQSTTSFIAPPSEEAEAQCANCRFWQGIRSQPFPDVDGWCRRYSPQGPVTKRSGDGWQLFPPMNHYQWCGEYERKRIPPVNQGTPAA